MSLEYARPVVVYSSATIALYAAAVASVRIREAVRGEETACTCA